MNKSSDTSTFLLGEVHGALMSLPSGQITPVTEFVTIGYSGGEAVAVFASRLDAEICRQYLNQRNQHGSKNRYQVIVNSDQRVGILKRTGNPPARLIVGFVVDHVTHKLVVQGGLYSLMHYDLHMADQHWLLCGGAKPDYSVIDSVRRDFLMMGVPNYLDELTEIESLDEKSLVDLAKLAVLQIGSLSSGVPAVPVVFSLRHKSWIELKVGGQHGAR